MMQTAARRRAKQKQAENIELSDPRSQIGAFVSVPRGDRAYVDGIDPNDSKRVLITYEMGLGKDSYPLHMLTLVHPSNEVELEEDLEKLKDTFTLGDQVASISFKVGDLLGTDDGHLAVIQTLDRHGFTIAISNGKFLEGSENDLTRWGYQRLWSEGDRVTPKHRPGSRYGTIVGFNPKNKKTPLLVKFDGEKTPGKWGEKAVIAADNSHPANIKTQPESIINEGFSPNKSDTYLNVGDRVRHSRGDRFFYQSLPYEEATVVAVSPDPPNLYQLAFAETPTDVWYPEHLLEKIDPISPSPHHPTPFSSPHPSPPIPHILTVGDRTHYYRAPDLIRWQVDSETPCKVRVKLAPDQYIALTTQNSKPITLWQHKVYCLPTEQEWQTAQHLQTKFQIALNDLANFLIDLGNYTSHLTAAGGYKKAPNPITSTVISFKDPVTDTQKLTFNLPWQVYPTCYSRYQVTEHTPKMIRYCHTFDGKGYESITSQNDIFICPDDATWEKFLELREQAIAASQAVQDYLNKLGTYQEAKRDGSRHQKRNGNSEPDPQPPTNPRRNPDPDGTPDTITNGKHPGQPADRGQTESREELLSDNRKPLKLCHLESQVKSWVERVRTTGHDPIAALTAIKHRKSPKYREIGCSNFGGLQEWIAGTFRQEDLEQACNNVLARLLDPPVQPPPEPERQPILEAESIRAQIEAIRRSGPVAPTGAEWNRYQVKKLGGKGDRKQTVTFPPGNGYYYTVKHKDAIFERADGKIVKAIQVGTQDSEAYKDWEARFARRRQIRELERKLKSFQ